MPITVDDIKRMPAKYKILAILFVFILVGYFYYFFLFGPALERKAKLAVQLESLEQKIRVKEQVARRIKDHIREKAELEAKLKTAIAKLPEEKEIPGLLTSVSQAGIEKGLEFVLFQPASPVPRDFYADIPVNIVIIGGFHDIIRFFESVAKLPRIVNVKDIAISKINVKRGQQSMHLLTTKCVIKTYMFLEKKDEGKAKKTTRQRGKK